VSTAGFLSIYPLSELPQLAKGKGVKLMNIPAKLTKSREELIKSIAINRGERGLRGKKLPRGFQQVSHLSIDEPLTK